MELHAPPHWRCVEFISDLHLRESQPLTLQALQAYLRHTSADAVMVLGDLFEAWVGDDMLLPASFEAHCSELLREASKRLALYLMPGNRDFLMGPALLQACGAKALPDPSVLVLGNSRWLLSHGDALCTDDQPYQRFRSMVRSAEWQQAFLARPLQERLALAQDMRRQSEAAQQAQIQYADVDAAQARQLLQSHGADQLIHGHTHRPAVHTLDDKGQVQRVVLSDWEPAANPPRGDVLQLAVAPEGHWQLKRLSLEGHPRSLA
jgi:UDP-2,3-diacylglucosamine hydrolase